LKVELIPLFSGILGLTPCLSERHNRAFIKVNFYGHERDAHASAMSLS